MLQSIRDHAQGWIAWIIVGLISIPFVLWGVHEYMRPAASQAIVEIGKAEISQNQFDETFRQRLRQLSNLWKNVDLSPLQAQLKQKVLSEMMEEELLVQLSNDKGLRVGDSLLLSQIHSFKPFQAEGKFSQAAYEQMLRNQGLTPTAFEAQMRRDLLTEQLHTGISRSALLTAYDRQLLIELDKQQRLITYLVVPSARFENNISVSDAEVEDYYNEHSKQYLTPEKVSIQYVELLQENLVSEQEVDEETLRQRYEERKDAFVTPPKWRARHILISVDKDATPDIDKAAKEKAEQVLARIKANESFEELAKQFSGDEVSAKQGGDLGWIESGKVVQPFEDALRALTVGTVSDVVKTDFGYHIIKLEEMTPSTAQSFEEVRTQLLDSLKRELAETTFPNKVEELTTLAYDQPNSLDGLAKQLKLTIKTTEAFERSGVKKDPILSNSKVLEAAFSDGVFKNGLNSEPIEVTPQHIVVLRAKECEEAKQKPVEEVKEGIVKLLKHQKAQAESEKLGKQLLEQLKQGKSADEVAKSNNLQWLPSQWVERQDSKFKQPAILQEAFRLGHPTSNQALYQGIALTGGDYGLLAVLSVKGGNLPDANGDKQKADQVKQTETQLKTAIGDSEFRGFITGVKSRTEIRIHKERLPFDNKDNFQF